MFLIEQEHLDKYMPKVKGVVYKNYHPDHIEKFKGLQAYGVSRLSEQDRKQHTNYQSQIGPTITALLNNDPIAIFGCGLLWHGVGEAWALFDEKARRYPIAMTKGAFAFFNIAEILFSLHRIQITVISEDKRALAWAHYLGFVSEGLMKEYSADKEDTFIMRRK
jgi:hypothetical protein|tara:strand:- start:851 stop:1342 length:492 start_codon:yes stop_codon:yes gene_type:complete